MKAVSPECVLHLSRISLFIGDAPVLRKLRAIERYQKRRDRSWTRRSRSDTSLPSEDDLWATPGRLTPLEDVTGWRIERGECLCAALTAVRDKPREAVWWIEMLAQVYVDVRTADEAQRLGLAEHATNTGLYAFGHKQANSFASAFEGQDLLWITVPDGSEGDDWGDCRSDTYCMFGPRVWRCRGVQVGRHSALAVEGAIRRAAHRVEQVDDAFEELARMDRTLVAESRGRTGIPAAVRAAVWYRDDGKCQECGSQVDLEFDHVIPVSRGGANTIHNVRVLCLKCNRTKGASVV